MKKSGAVAVMVLLAALSVLPGSAESDVYIEGYMGGGTVHDTSAPIGIGGAFPDTPGKINSFFTGGVKLGTWFDRTGFMAGSNWPEWTKYLGFYFDFNYHNIDFDTQTLGGIPGVDWSSRGRAATLAFMFAARYGFMPDSAVPFGRVQPYLAVGPAVVFSWQEPTIVGLSAGNKSSTDLALAVEAGIRFMALKNVSLDLSFKYRWVEPKYDYDFGGIPVTLDPTYHIFIGALGAAYHF